MNQEWGIVLFLLTSLVPGFLLRKLLIKTNTPRHLFWTFSLTGYSAGILSGFLKLVWRPLLGLPVDQPLLTAIAAEAWPEELLRGLGLFFLFALRPPMGRRQALYLGAASGAGFALMEQVLYQILSPEILWIRLISAVPFHIFLGGIWGRLGISRSKRSFFFLLISLSVLHGVYNFFLLPGLPWPLALSVGALAGFFYLILLAQGDQPQEDSRQFWTDR